ncbi:MAG TPA: hypothetical protein VKV26_06275 [Dehalococcoidia bacterium]|nr:hypothetical protein [Dehalococcoidia bacterium]
MRYVEAFFRFWYDFLIGDDWRIAAGVVIVLLLTAAVVHGVSARAAGAIVLAGVLLVEGYALWKAVRAGA